MSSNQTATEQVLGSAQLTHLEAIEAAAKLGRRLEKLEVDKAAALRDWQERLDIRYAEKRAKLIAEAPTEVIAMLEIVP